MPGGRCPYCKTNLRFDRKGKHYCRKCRGPLEVDIKDVDVDPDAYGKKTDARTTIKPTDERRHRYYEARRKAGLE
jgi:predicted amidophosphoribosyltransferase